jgi:uncharacterized damage-inducible protein DinB
MSTPTPSSTRLYQSLSEAFLAELDMEMPTTRRLLERVPGDKGAWKPHEKSFSMGHLAQLVARMPGWISQAMRETVLDLQGAPTYSLEATETLLAEFDRSAKSAREALTAARDEDYLVPWSLAAGGRVLFTMPRLAVVRQTINHLVHHRGQLSVYLRMVNVPLPSIYGPTADEGWSG